MRINECFLLISLCSGIGAGQVLAQADPTAVPVENVTLPTPPTDVLRLIVTTTNKSSQRRIPGVRVAVFAEGTGQLAAVGQTDATGTLTLEMPFRGAYRIETCEPTFLSAGARIEDCGGKNKEKPTLMCVEGFDFFSYDDAAAKTGVDHLLLADLKLDSLAVGGIVDLDNILYDYDKATLRPKSKTELNQLVRALKQLPGLSIELRSHTDSRGSDSYNQDLSQRRAQSVVDYLIANGIDAGRFTAKGFGESRLLNECADGVTCSEDKHQRNRRTEFEVKAYSPAPCEELVVGR